MNYEKLYKDALERARESLKDDGMSQNTIDYLTSIFPELKESKKIKFRKFDIITNGKIEYGIKDIQKNGFGDWIYILYNADIANLLPNDLPDGSIGWICENKLMNNLNSNKGRKDENYQTRKEKSECKAVNLLQM